MIFVNTINTNKVNTFLFHLNVAKVSVRQCNLYQNIMESTQISNHHMIQFGVFYRTLNLLI